MKPLQTPVLLGVSGLDPLWHYPQLDPPCGQWREASQPHTSEGRPVVGADDVGQAVLSESPIQYALNLWTGGALQTVAHQQVTGHGVLGRQGINAHLDLSYSQLTGEIPSWLGNLANLEVLTLSANQLTGEIPFELGGLANLRVLLLHDNQLSGGIPPELGRLTNLVALNLLSNRLSGEIPSWLGNLANLELLHLSNNQMTGEIPPELGRLSNLLLDSSLRSE